MFYQEVKLAAKEIIAGKHKNLKTAASVTDLDKMMYS